MDGRREYGSGVRRKRGGKEIERYALMSTKGTRKRKSEFRRVCREERLECVKRGHEPTRER